MNAHFASVGEKLANELKSTNISFKGIGGGVWHFFCKFVYSNRACFADFRTFYGVRKFQVLFELSYKMWTPFLSYLPHFAPQNGHF